MASVAAGRQWPVSVHYDFASTLCYVAHRCLGRMRDDLAALDLELCWTPLDLAGLLGWPRDGVVEGPRRDNALRVARELGVPLRMPAVWLDSRPAAAVALALDDPARAAAWRERVFSAIYEEGLDPGDPAVLHRLASDLRFDLEPARLARGRTELDRRTHDAKSAEVTGVPTFMLDEWPFGGIQEDRTMRSIFERYVRKKRREASAAEVDA